MTYASEVLADSPVRYYACQETSGTTLTDSSGNAGHGTINGGAVVNDPTDPASPAGTGLHIRLDGSNDFLDLQSGTNYFTPATAGFTWEGWFRQRTVQAYARMFDFSTGGLDMELSRSNLDNHYRVDTGGGNTAFASPSDIGNWVHIVVTCTTGGSVKLYINGSLFATQSVGAPTNAARTKYVGKSPGSPGSDPFYSGSVTQIAIYNSVLSGARVAAHYAAGVATPSPPAAPTGLSTDPDVTAIELSWSASTGSPDGYDVRINAGTPIDVGNVLSYDFTGLAPASGPHTLEVRAYNAYGDSSWSSTTASTDDLPPPTDLTILGDDEDTITVGWDTHPYAEGFEVRIDGGTAEDIGLTTLHMWDLLDPSTMYELEVRAYLDGVFSDWASIDGTTEGPPPPEGEYIVHLVVGSHEWFIAWDDVLDPDDPVQVLDGLKIDWNLVESDPWPSQPAPSSIEVGFYAVDVLELDADLAIGTPMYAILEDGDGNEFATFHGRVTEAQVKPIKRKAGVRMLYTVKGDDYTVDLFEDPVTLTTAWPAESADDRMARIVTLAATVGLVLEAPADTGTAAFDALTTGTTTIGDLVGSHLRQIALPGPLRYIVSPVVDVDGLLDHFEFVAIENEVDSAFLPGTFAIIDGLWTIVFPDEDADGVLDAGDINLYTTWTRLKFRAINRVVITGPVSAEASRPAATVVGLDLQTTLTDQDTVDLMADLYLPDTDEALGWVADRFLFYAHRNQAGLLPPWFPDHRDDPPETGCYVNPFVILGIPANINLAGTTAMAGQLSKAALRIERRKVEVEFALRRQLPTATGADGASYQWVQDNFPTVTYDDVDPGLSYYEARLGRAI